MESDKCFVYSAERVGGGEGVVVVGVGVGGVGGGGVFGVAVVGADVVLSYQRYQAELTVVLDLDFIRTHRPHSLSLIHI